MNPALKETVRELYDYVNSEMGGSLLYLDTPLEAAAGRILELLRDQDETVQRLSREKAELEDEAEHYESLVDTLTPFEAEVKRLRKKLANIAEEAKT